MRKQADSTTHVGEHVTRIAWLFTFVVPLILVAVLLWAVKPAAASTVGSSTVEPPAPAETSNEVETEDGEECDEVDEEGFVFEDCEEGEEGKEESGTRLPSECLLRTARARVFTYSSHDKVRLEIRYTSVVPANVTIDFRLDGGKGSLKLGRVYRRFAKQGVLRITESLTKSGMEKVKAAKRFDVELSIPGAPRYCHPYYGWDLTAKRSVHGQAVWFQSN
jgi:hypothetical protein